ncbi:hypothetical protein CBER1_10666 [Cercospora berteroae]|uniref:Uncharacterized protein n=1 Tax=Cercospora berteroae TaxID=357750 RepID=A0A2S6CN11_9PEZI|nr:hypothetical protein CBER1_10666 [Cercospora berteroae]
MDANELALMLADLDNSRRDGLSAPDEAQARRGGSYNREFEKTQFVEQENASRQARLAGSPTNAIHAHLQAWNTPSSFGKDETAELTRNWNGGQGHRLMLQEKRGDHGHGARMGSYQHERHPRIQQVELPRPVRDPKRARAPSPRSGGVTRWVNGVAVKSTTPIAPSRAAQKPKARPISSTPPFAPSPAHRPVARPISRTSPIPPPSPAPKPAVRSLVSTTSASSTPPISRTPSVAPPAPQPVMRAPPSPQATSPLTAPRPVARTAAFSPVVANKPLQIQKAREPAFKEASSKNESDFSLFSNAPKVRESATTNGDIKKSESLPSPPDSAERPRRKSFAETALDALKTVGTAAKAVLNGILDVNYYDGEGTHRGHRRIEVAAPLRVNVDVRAKGEYDPLQMAAEMEALAKYLIRNF